MPGSEGDLARAVKLIGWLEQDLDREIQHSPFTIGFIPKTGTGQPVGDDHRKENIFTASETDE